METPTNRIPTVPGTPVPDVHRLPTNLLGISKSTILPSLGVNGGLSIIAYGIGRATDRVELKDYLWATGMVANAWWTAIGRHTFSNPQVSLGQAWSRLTYNEIALLGAVTAWGVRLTYRVISRSFRRGKDDARYEEEKTQPGYWNKALFGIFVPEAVFQSIITLPFTMPFRSEALEGFSAASADWAGWIRVAAAGLFTTGLVLETLADYQVESHKRNAEEKGQNGLYRRGVWSIVRHPNYLGDALCHFAFPLWNYGSGIFSPWQLLGPVANYIFLRGVGGDKQNEESQEQRYYRENHKKYHDLKAWRNEKNSFWPSIGELVNPWTLVCLAAGATAASAEYMCEASH